MPKMESWPTGFKQDAERADDNIQPRETCRQPDPVPIFLAGKEQPLRQKPQVAKSILQALLAAQVKPVGSPSGLFRAFLLRGSEHVGA